MRGPSSHFIIIIWSMVMLPKYSLLPLFSILLSQVFFGYCNVVALLGFIIHQSLEDTFVGAPILWLKSEVTVYGWLLLHYLS